MKLSGKFVFDGNQNDVWELLRDPDALAKALPGTQSLEKVSENEYTGKMHVRVGPVSGVFAGKLTISDEAPPESYTLQVDGRGAPGFVKGTGSIQLTAQDNSKTLMQYTGDVQIGGRLASVGQRLIDSVSKSMVRQGLETLNMALQAKHAPPIPTSEAAAEQPPAFTPPTEMEFALGVAKDMLADVFSPENKRVWELIAAALVSFALGFWFGSKRRDG